MAKPKSLGSKTTLMDKRVPKKPCRKGLTSEGNIGTGGNLNSKKK